MITELDFLNTFYSHYVSLNAKIKHWFFKNMDSNLILKNWSIINNGEITIVIYFFDIKTDTSNAMQLSYKTFFD